MGVSGSGNKNLLIPNKGAQSAHPGYATDMRSIEQWASGLPTPSGGTITDITSTDGSVVITNPTGPVVDLSVTSPGGYLSLTGAGQTATPGDLTQLGGFTVTETSGTTGFHVDVEGAIVIRQQSGSTNPITLLSGHALNLEGGTLVNLFSSTAQVAIEAASFVSIQADAGSAQISASGTFSDVHLSAARYIVLNSSFTTLPTSDPGFSGALWRDGSNVVHISP